MKIVSCVDRLKIDPLTGFSSLLGSDYYLFKLTKFKFYSHVFAPAFGIITKTHGTIYPLEYDNTRDEIEGEVVVFGF